MYDENVPMKADKRDERIDLMERYVGLEQSLAMAQSERDDATERVRRVREEMKALRQDIKRSVESVDEVTAGPSEGMSLR